MKDKITVNAGGGIGTFGLLGVAFVVLKLTGYIAWPWIWVLAPFWIPLAIVLGIIAVIGLVLLIAFLSK